MVIIRHIILFTLLLLLSGSHVYAQTAEDWIDPYDPFARGKQNELEQGKDPDKNKTASELIREALLLQGQERLLDSRTKLLKALKKSYGRDAEHILALLNLLQA